MSEQRGAWQPVLDQTDSTPQGLQQYIQLAMVFLSRQKIPTLLALTLFILPIPIASSNPIPGALLSLRKTIQVDEPSPVWWGSTTGMDQQKSLIAELECSNPGTQAAINNCAGMLARESDDALNQTYQKLRSTLSAAQEKLLVNAQLSWIKFRDEHCALERSFLGDGSLSTTSQLTCIKRMSDEREKGLHSLLTVRNFYGIIKPSQVKIIDGRSKDSQAANVIGPDRIGPVVIGKTLGELRRSLGNNDSLQAKQRLMANIDAIPLVRKGNIQLYILFPEGASITDESVILSLLTKNPDYKTKEGVGPGMRVAEVEQIYGKPTLFYNASNESREYATFSRQSSRHIRFGVRINGHSLAGDYAKPSKEYKQSQQYHGTVYIAFIEVIAP